MMVDFCHTLYTAIAEIKSFRLLFFVLFERRSSFTVAASSICISNPGNANSLADIKSHGILSLFRYSTYDLMTGN